MTTLQLVVLAVVQGITEFLPISSSAHLILVPHVFGWPDQGRQIDVAVHLGTLAAVCLYARAELVRMLAGTLNLVRGRLDRDAWLALYVALATVPALAAGLALVALDVADAMRSVTVIAWANLVFAGLLYAADRFMPADGDLGRLDWRGALLVGVMQALALIPGTSRAGITMTAGRFLGLQRTEAARFSLLLAIPLILVAGLHACWEIARAGDPLLGGDALFAAAIAFATALVAIWAMMRWLAHAGFGLFVAYRLALGVLLLWWVG